MADGIKCIHCGWQEVDHLEPPTETIPLYGNPSRMLPGYSVSLYDCAPGGFVPEEKTEAALS